MSAANHVPPQPTVYRTRPGAPGAITRNAVVAAYPYARPVGCFPFGPAGEPHIVVLPDYPPHNYEMSMIWPANAVRALCRICRGTHCND